MIRYVGARLLQMIPLLLGVTIISFGVMQLAPGDFLDEMRLNPIVSEQTVAQMKANFGIDKPAYVQYVKWLSRLVQGDFGYSFAWQVPVTWLIASRLFNTLILNIVALAFAWSLAVPIGIHAATHQYAWSDNLLSFVAYLGISTPTFFSGLLGLYLAFKTRLLPIGGMTSVRYDELATLGRIGDVAHHLILPVLILGFGAVAGLMRQMRGNLLEVLRQDYVKTARSKGLAERTVIYRHAVRNAINPLITIFGFELGALLSGSAILEITIGWPGLGMLILEAFQKKDVYLVMGSLTIGAVALVMGNLVADIMLAWVDPRIRYD